MAGGPKSSTSNVDVDNSYDIQCRSGATVHGGGTPFAIFVGKECQEMAHDLKITNGPNAETLFLALRRKGVVQFSAVKPGVETANTIRFNALPTAISRTSQERYWMVTGLVQLNANQHGRLDIANRGVRRILRGLYDPFTRRGDMMLITPDEARALLANAAREPRRIRIEIDVPDDEVGIAIGMLDEGALLSS